MYYVGKGVSCTETGAPACCLDSVTCNVIGCRYFVLYSPLGNCVLRIDKSDCMTLEEISRSLSCYDKRTQGVKGWGLSRQRVEQMEKVALRKLRKKIGTHDLVEALITCVELRNRLP